MRGAHVQTRRLSGDDGLGMLTVITVMAVISALAITATTLSISNLDNARRDRQALGALATSEAGVAQALSFLRTGNLGALTCMEPVGGAPLTGTCLSSTESWTSSVAPRSVRLDGSAGPCTSSSDCYKVWISTIRPYSPRCSGRNLTPPVPCKGKYRVHVTGVSGNGPGARSLAVDVEAGPQSYPMGVFSEGFTGSGVLGVHRMSLFSLGCIVNRRPDNAGGSGVSFEYDTATGRPVLDLIYDQPSAAHATLQVSTNNNTCGDPIHGPSVRCNPLYPWDQSGQGAAFTGSDTCGTGTLRHTRADGTVYPTTSKFDETTLLQRYGYRPRGLSDAQYDSLKSQAVAQGTYNLAPGSIASTLTSLATTGVSSPVLYWDTGDVSLHENDFPAVFKRPVDLAATCVARSVTIVVSGPGNDLSYQGGATAPYLSAAIFVPDGELTGTGARKTIGTVFAKSVDLSGGSDYHMDECFAHNPPGATVGVEVVDWREDDSRDIDQG